MVAAGLCAAQETLPLPSGSDFELDVRRAALAALDANQALLAERAPLYTGPDAAANLATLRARVDDLDGLLTQSAGLMHELVWIDRERAQAARLMNGGPVEIADANRIMERLAREEAELVAALIETSEAMDALTVAYPEAARFVELDVGLDLAFTHTELPGQVARSTLEADDALALEQIAEAFVEVDRSIERAREGLTSGRIPAYALTRTAEAVLEALWEEDPLAAGLAEEELERWRSQAANRRTALAVAEVGLLAGAVFTGGTLTTVLRLGSGVAAFGLTADYVVDARRTSLLAETHLDPHEGFVAQSEAREATLDAVVAGALQAASAALAVRAGVRTLARAPTRTPASGPAPQPETVGVTGRLLEDVHPGGPRTDATLPVGRGGRTIAVLDGTNAPQTIAGRYYTGHALDRMQQQGIMPRVVEDIIRSNSVPGKNPGTLAHFDTTHPRGLTVITDAASGRVVTVDFGIIRQ
ncbi:MAG: hypothetical protein R3F62_03235 [Planctomycetota bacterium]